MEKENLLKLEIHRVNRNEAEKGQWKQRSVELFLIERLKKGWDTAVRGER